MRFLYLTKQQKHMSIEDYQRNLRGVNDGTNFSPEFLVGGFLLLKIYGVHSQQQSVYDSIRKREIVMPEEHTGQLGFEYAWKELLTRSRQSGKSIVQKL
jgi:golgi-specific brefeldin A-resistance guanine nucleotide exchange factor 1